MCGYVHRVLARYRAVLTGITAVTRSAVVSGTVVPIRHDQFVSRSLPPLKVRESNSEYLWVYLWVVLFQGA